jgi:hypothetical protein
MVKIFVIYAENCVHCDAALATIESAMKKCPNISCELVKFLYDNKVAIQIAINRGIDDLPGIVVGDRTFVGDNYTEKDIIGAIKSNA